MSRNGFVPRAAVFGGRIFVLAWPDDRWEILGLGPVEAHYRFPYDPRNKGSWCVPLTLLSQIDRFFWEEQGLGVSFGQGVITVDYGGMVIEYKASTDELTLALADKLADGFVGLEYGQRLRACRRGNGPIELEIWDERGGWVVRPVGGRPTGEWIRKIGECYDQVKETSLGLVLPDFPDLARAVPKQIRPDPVDPIGAMRGWARENLQGLRYRLGQTGANNPWIKVFRVDGKSRHFQINLPTRNKPTFESRQQLSGSRNMQAIAKHNYFWLCMEDIIQRIEKGKKKGKWKVR